LASADEVLQMKGLLGVVPEILAVEQLQLIGDQGDNRLVAGSG
jgi:hypothetical protein